MNFILTYLPEIATSIVLAFLLFLSISYAIRLHANTKKLDVEYEAILTDKLKALNTVKEELKSSKASKEREEQGTAKKEGNIFVASEPGSEYRKEETKERTVLTEKEGRLSLYTIATSNAIKKQEYIEAILNQLDKKDLSSTETIQSLRAFLSEKSDALLKTILLDIKLSNISKLNYPETSIESEIQSRIEDTIKELNSLTKGKQITLND